MGIKAKLIIVSNAHTKDSKEKRERERESESARAREREREWMGCKGQGRLADMCKSCLPPHGNCLPDTLQSCKAHQSCQQVPKDAVGDTDPGTSSTRTRSMKIAGSSVPRRERVQYINLGQSCPLDD